MIDPDPAQPCAMPAALLPIHDVTPFTMLDFPGRTACIIWIAGCNMRCAYCHNPQIVKSKGRFEVAQIYAFLAKRKGLLDGVVLSGGEATRFPEILGFARHIKELGFAVKLDTNGTRPEIVQRMVTEGCVDFIALDYKAPANKFTAMSQCKEWEAFAETLAFLTTQTHVPIEIRTTVHTSLLGEDDLNAIMDDLAHHSYHGTYAIQNFTDRNHRAGFTPMPPQERVIDQSMLTLPEDMKVEFRNF